MDEALYIFHPDVSEMNTTLWVAAVIALAGLGGSIAIIRKPAVREDRNRRLLGAMLLFFVFMIGAATAFFSFWTTLKIGDVLIYEDAIVTPYGKVDFREIKNASIQEHQEPSLITSSVVRNRYKVLTIEENSGKVHLLSEENYELPEIMRKLKQTVREWKEKDGREEPGDR